MITVRYGGKRGAALRLTESSSHIVVRTTDRGRLDSRRTFGGTPLRVDSRKVLDQFDSIARYDEAGVEVLRLRSGRKSRTTRDHARSILKQDQAIEFAGRVLVEPRSGRHYLYTENFFVKFDDEASPTACRKILKQCKLKVKRELGYARNAYFVAAPQGTGMEVFDVAKHLLDEAKVELCHPELVRERRIRAAFPQQWHLKKTTVNGRVIDQHASVESAWELSQGENIVIAVIDDGVDIDHEEFRSSLKVVAPRDVTRGTDNPRPRGLHDDHGTACAGVACANGKFGASGVAPLARLMPIRMAAQLGSQAEADAFAWAADQGADVISCSWGPTDGDFQNNADPLHRHREPLPDSTRLAIDYAITHGRQGRGCVVLFAAGNGNESVDNDGYASYPNVIAVAACDDRGQRAPYSDFGKAVFCSFPSNHYFPSLTPGIWTTDRSGGLGYNWGDTKLGDDLGRYANNFGGTSSACPGVAGVAALVLARNPELRWQEVREILKSSCDRIDTRNGRYDDEGHSEWYGYGRVNARRAVELAVPVRTIPLTIHTTAKDVPIRDFRTSRLSLDVSGASPLTSLRVSVHLLHSWIGDLVIQLRPPPELGLDPIVLHDKAGGAQRNLNESYDTITTPPLVACVGRSPNGKWVLEVSDHARRDEGTLKSFTLALGG